MRAIFVNLPVADLSRADAFYAALGLRRNDQFSDDTKDHGVMYGSSFADPDGNAWEAMWMDPAALQG